MKHIKIATLIFGILLFGCKHTENKNYTVSDEISTVNSNEKVGKQEKFDDNEKLKADKVACINNVIELFKLKYVEKISNIISFPLDRQYPIPSIKNKIEFINRFNEVFDQFLIDRIAKSKIEQWTEVGWRGIMLDDGIVWMANSDGIITDVTYQSEIENKLRKDMISKEKEHLHKSLKVFENPTFRIKTKTALIRIDELKKNKYRYASWKIGEEETSKPDIVIYNGLIEFEGSGGNHVISFSKGNYTYKVYRNIIKDEKTSDITHEVEKDGVLILSEEGN